MILDTQNDKLKVDWHNIEIKDVSAAKRIIGHSDEFWGSNVPRFKPTATTTGINPGQLARETAKEYVYGNSSTVSDWAGVINQTIFNEVWNFPLFLHGTVTVNAGGVLIVGDKGNFFVCERLRMHVSSTLLIRGSGPIHIQPLSFESLC